MISKERRAASTSVSPARVELQHLADNVRGSLLADYVRMILSHDEVDWRRCLAPADLDLLAQRISDDDWYPIPTLERLADTILDEIADGSLDRMRRWGRDSVDRLVAAQPDLVKTEDPVESLRRLTVLRGSCFDFEALEVLALTMKSATLRFTFHMSGKAEEAASYYTMGVLERVIELGGGSQVRGYFRQRSWVGYEQTLLQLNWRLPISLRLRGESGRVSRVRSSAA